MKRYLVFGLSLLLTASVAAKEKTPTIIKAWRLQPVVSLADSVSVHQDTTCINFPMRSFIYDYSLANDFNSNIVSPIESKIFFDRHQKDRSLFTQAYFPFLITAQDVRFFHTNTPFSRISYKKGFRTYREENDLQFFFTGNVTRRFNLGVGLNYLNSVGHYANQAGKLFNGDVFGSYNGNHYSLHAAFTFNTINNFENGGIANSNDLGGELSTEDIPVRLNGMSGCSYLSGLLNHYYSICTERERTVHYKVRDEEGKWEKKDSIAIEYVPVTTFMHTFEVNNATHRYVEKQARQGFYADTYRNAKVTNDTANVINIRNTLAVTFEEEFNTVLKFGATVYAMNECQRYLYRINPQPAYTFEKINNRYEDLQAFGPAIALADSALDYQWLNNTFVGGSLYKNRGKYVHYGFNGDVCVLGYKIGEFQVNGHIDGDFRLGKDTMTISAKAYFKSEKPDFYLNRYVSNHFHWDNDFDKQMSFYVGGEIAYPTQWVKPKLNIGFENITKYIYFNSLGKPTQHEGNIQVFAANLQCDITTPWVNLENHVIYQHSSDSALALPAITLYHNLYYHGVWFKALEAQIGVDMSYHTAYYAPVLMPAIGQFCAQQKTKVGNYPVLNVYASFYVRLLRLKFFAQYQHFNRGLMKNANFYSMPGYPLEYDMFRAGLAFHFYK